MSKSGSSSNSESETEVFGDIYEDYVGQGELEVENDFQHGRSEADTNNISNFTNVYMEEPLADEIWLNEYLKNKAEEERVGAKVWNSVPEYLRNLKKKDFTSKIHTLLIEIMNNEDDYVDLPMICRECLFDLIFNISWVHY
ncbi:Hypothetical predicted protein [Paramuricea clavata]|uniref:Uncharacterized protein n=1 Tax=Paramuricea clavata TaxID=317549 RepID=A0A7D9EDN2_PARCT|nr:Hypothetical predicted protein [Paramuricea clavata]